MKRICVFILLLLRADSGVACSCAPGILNESYAAAELVVRARIIRTFPNSAPENPYYKVEIEPIETFKGRAVRELFVSGSMDGLPRSSCDLFVNEGSE